MRRAPRRCACGFRIEPGALCACQRKRIAQREANRPTAAQRGYTGKWARESAAFLALPQNRMCACGCGRPAEVVDHKQAHKGDHRLMWDRTNWQPMTRACNSRKNARHEGGFGNPIK